MSLFVRYNSISDEALMKRLQNRDIKAFDFIYTRYYSKLILFANKMLNDKDLAKDVIQDVFYRVLHHPEKFNVAKKFSSWIFTVVANECRKKFRDKRHFDDVKDLHVSDTSVTDSLKEDQLIDFKEKLEIALNKMSL